MSKLQSRRLLGAAVALLSLLALPARAQTLSCADTVAFEVASTHFFAEHDLVDGETTGVEIWASDGTNTCMLAEIAGTDGSTPAGFTKFGTKVYFSATDATNGNELWESDGTALGTKLFFDANGGDRSSFPSSLTVVGRQLYFVATTDAAGRELWVTDGITPPQQPVADIQSGVNGSLPTELVVVGSTLYFVANDGSGDTIWKTDTNVTSKVHQDTNTTAPSAPHRLTALGSTLFFVASTSASGFELWRTTGTDETLVGEIRPNAASADPHGLTTVGTTLYFAADDGSTGRELWKVSEAGAPEQVANIRSGSDSALAAPASSSPFLTANLSDTTLVFNANNAALGTNDTELWKADAGGASLVKDINGSTTTSSAPAEFVVIGSKVYFRANGGSTQGDELWSTDGTEAGTTLVTDLNTASGQSSRPHRLAAVDSKLYFFANDDGRSVELWVHDPAGGGTTTQLHEFQRKVSTPRSSGGGGGAMPLALLAWLAVAVLLHRRTLNNRTL